MNSAVYSNKNTLHHLHYRFSYIFSYDRKITRVRSFFIHIRSHAARICAFTVSSNKVRVRVIKRLKYVLESVILYPVEKDMVRAQREFRGQDRTLSIQIKGKNSERQENIRAATLFKRIRTRRFSKAIPCAICLELTARTRGINQTIESSLRVA